MRPSVILLLILSMLMPVASAAANPPHLRQLNPARVAKYPVNTPATQIWDAYPWFSQDGKLFFWTREQNGVAHVLVSYLKNRPHLFNEAAGDPLPELQVSTPKRLPGAWNNGTALSQTVKAISYCHQTLQDNFPVFGQKQYTFTMFYATGVATQRKLYRIRNLVVRLNKSTKEIIHMAAPNAPELMGPAVNVSQRNQTEPMMTRDGKFLFWASNAPSFSPMARHIEVGQACTQLNQNPTPYSSLPSHRFAWVDQYTNGFNIDRTRTTNYHTVLERGAIGNSKTALIFERCNALVTNTTCASNPDSRYCDCVSADDQSVPYSNRFGVLMSTGFEVGEQPAPIKGCYNPALNQQIGGRDTHPAISGPQSQDGRWLMFFMRGKRVWYTIIGECPPGSAACNCL